MSNPNPNKWQKRAKRIGIAIGITGVSITIAVIPFLLPAFRKYCLPYVPATPLQINKVCDLMKGRNGTIVDLGSGDGRVVISLAKRGHYAVGYELNSLLIIISRITALINGVSKNTEFHRKDLWKVNLSQYDNILFFGVEQMMEPLGEKINNEALPTTNVISCRFMFPQWKPFYSFERGPNSVWMYKTTPTVTITTRMYHSNSSYNKILML